MTIPLNFDSKCWLFCKPIIKDSWEMGFTPLVPAVGTQLCWFSDGLLPPPQFQCACFQAIVIRVLNVTVRHDWLSSLHIFFFFSVNRIYQTEHRGLQWICWRLFVRPCIVRTWIISSWWHLCQRTVVVTHCQKAVWVTVPSRARRVE